MRKTIFFLLALAIFLASAQSAFSDTEIIEVCQDVNIRSSASYTHRYKGRAHVGDRFPLTGQEGEWYIIEYGDGRKGYIPKHACKQAAQEISAPAEQREYPLDTSGQDIVYSRYEICKGRFTWQEAKKLARDMGGYLINIDSLEEYLEVQSMLYCFRMQDVSFWIGVYRPSQANLLDTADSFCLVNPYGGPRDGSYTASSFVDILGGRDPWALGEPSFRNEKDENERFVLLRYSEGEGRWVWDNTTDVLDSDREYGFIIEKDKYTPAACLTQEELDSWQGLATANYSKGAATDYASEPYKVWNVEFDGKAAYVDVTTPETCALTVSFYDANSDVHLTTVTEWAYAGCLGETIKVVIPEDKLALVQGPCTVYARLRTYNAQDGFGEELTKWVPCRYVFGAVPAYDPGPEYSDWFEKENGLYLTYFTFADDPGSRLSYPVTIRKIGEEQPLHTTRTNDFVFLPKGDYRATVPGEEDISFTVESANQIIRLREPQHISVQGKVIDPRSREPLSGIPVALESQGLYMTAITDKNGIFTAEDVAPADMRVYILSDNMVIGRNIADPTGKNRSQSLVEDYYIGEFEVQETDQVAFFGYLSTEGIETSDEQVHALIDRTNWWCVGYGLYLIADEDILKNGDARSIYNFGNDGPRSGFRKVTKEDVGEGAEETAASWDFEMEGDRSELLVVSGRAYDSMLKANNPEYAGWFMGWGKKNINDSWTDTYLETPIRAYYRRLIKAIDQGTNPVGDYTADQKVLTAILRRRMEEGGVAGNKIDEIIETVRTARREIQELYLLSLFSYDYYQMTWEEMEKEGATYNLTGLYKSQYQQLRLLQGAVGDEGYVTTFFHESGHAVSSHFDKWFYENFDLEKWVYKNEDAKSTREYEIMNDELYGTNLRNSILVDVERLIGGEIDSCADKKMTENQKNRVLLAFVNDEVLEKDGDVPSSIRGDKQLEKLYRTVKNNIEKEIKKIPSADMSMIDLIGGITNNKIKGNYSHDEVDRYGEMYWWDYVDEKEKTVPTGDPSAVGNARSSHLEQEGYAEWFAAWMTGDQVHIDANHKYFPRTISEYWRMTQDLHDYYYDYWSALYGE